MYPCPCPYRAGASVSAGFRHPLRRAWAPCAPRAPPGRSAAAAGHGIVNESDDLVANWRRELPGGDLHGPSKGIPCQLIAPCRIRSCRSTFSQTGGDAAERAAVRWYSARQQSLSSGSDRNHAAGSRDRHRVMADAGPSGSRRLGIPVHEGLPRRSDMSVSDRCVRRLLHEIGNRRGGGVK